MLTFEKLSEDFFKVLVDGNVLGKVMPILNAFEELGYIEFVEEFTDFNGVTELFYNGDCAEIERLEYRLMNIL